MEASEESGVSVKPIHGMEIEVRKLVKERVDVRGWLANFSNSLSKFGRAFAGVGVRESIGARGELCTGFLVFHTVVGWGSKTARCLVEFAHVSTVGAFEYSFGRLGQFLGIMLQTFSGFDYHLAG